ncbi:hypothetical protein SH661x_002760 [Planctomicrobium sp. SH661]|uniref:hypothetical protein n=1 Tax=Planctomicrobium sp. SH661 TaxID=3448124 RepID=UPI003F5B97D5
MIPSPSLETGLQHYEQLRQQVLMGVALTSQRWGLNLLLTRGLAAWMQAWSAEAASPSPAASVPVTGQQTSLESVPLSDLLQQQLTSALVEMLLRQTPALA